MPPDSHRPITTFVPVSRYGAAWTSAAADEMWASQLSLTSMYTFCPRMAASRNSPRPDPCRGLPSPAPARPLPRLVQVALLAFPGKSPPAPPLRRRHAAGWIRQQRGIAGGELPEGRADGWDEGCTPPDESGVAVDFAMSASRGIDSSGLSAIRETDGRPGSNAGPEDISAVGFRFNGVASAWASVKSSAFTPRSGEEFRSEDEDADEKDSYLYPPRSPVNATSAIPAATTSQRDGFHLYP